MLESISLILLCLLLPGSSDQLAADLSAADIAGNVGFAPFARVQGSLSPQQWKAEACPVEATSYSCYWHNATRGWDVEHRPMPGAKRPFSVATFESLIRCRDLVLAGDSITGQFFQTLACLLRRPDTQFSVSWAKPFHEKLCPFGTEHCALGDGCATFHHLAARLCFSSDLLLRFSPSDYCLQNDSILVASTAYHHEDSKALRKALGKFTGDYVRMPSPSRPVVVWAEAPPQHFPLHPSGYYRGKRLKYARSKPLKLEAGYAHDWRNRIANMDPPTQPLWDFHVVRNGRTDQFNERIDCTHYCLPGASLLWAVALTDLLASLITPKGTACRDRRRLTPEADLLLRKPQEPQEPPVTKIHKDRNHKKERRKG